MDEGLGEPWRCRLDRFAPLRVSDDPYDGGYELAEELASLDDISDVAKLVGTGRPVCLAYSCQDTHATFAAYFTEIAVDAHTMTAVVESTFVFHRDDEYPKPGQWFEGWLISLVMASRAEVCAYGNREIIDKSMPLAAVLERLRQPRYDALDPARILRRLRTGDLLELPAPVFHAMSIELIGMQEMRKLMKKRSHSPRLAHEVAPGYHILSNIY